MAGILYGVGVGPGDPEMLTLKALRVLRDVDLICVPISSPGKKSLALSIVQQAIDSKPVCREFLFPMTRKRKRLQEAWNNTAREIIDELTAGKDLAFITLGDPLLYSTYLHLLQEIRSLKQGVRVETVPGISSFQAAAARLNLPLALEEEGLALLPAPEEKERLESVLSSFENVVLLKPPLAREHLLQTLMDKGLADSCWLIQRCGHEEEVLYQSLDTLSEEDLTDYLSLLIIKRGGCS